MSLFATLTLSTMLTLMQVVGRDGSEISAEGREDVISLGSAAFAQVRGPPIWVTVTADHMLNVYLLASYFNFT